MFNLSCSVWPQLNCRLQGAFCSGTERVPYGSYAWQLSCPGQNCKQGNCLPMFSNICFFSNIDTFERTSFIFWRGSKQIIIDAEMDTVWSQAIWTVHQPKTHSHTLTLTQKHTPPHSHWNDFHSRLVLHSLFDWPDTEGPSISRQRPQKWKNQLCMTSPLNLQLRTPICFSTEDPGYIWGFWRPRWIADSGLMPLAISVFVMKKMLMCMCTCAFSAESLLHEPTTTSYCLKSTKTVLLFKTYIKKIFSSAKEQRGWCVWSNLLKYILNQNGWKLWKLWLQH